MMLAFRFCNRGNGWIFGKGGGSQEQKKNSNLTLPKTNMSPEDEMSFWDGPVFGDMLIFQGG